MACFVYRGNGSHPEQSFASPSRPPKPDGRRSAEGANGRLPRDSASLTLFTGVLRWQQRLDHAHGATRALAPPCAEFTADQTLASAAPVCLDDRYVAEIILAKVKVD